VIPILSSGPDPTGSDTLSALLDNLMRWVLAVVELPPPQTAKLAARPRLETPNIA
jgi:hypothetical protein